MFRKYIYFNIQKMLLYYKKICEDINQHITTHKYSIYLCEL